MSPFLPGGGSRVAECYSPDPIYRRPCGPFRHVTTLRQPDLVPPRDSHPSVPHSNPLRGMGERHLSHPTVAAFGVFTGQPPGRLLSGSSTCRLTATHISTVRYGARIGFHPARMHPVSCCPSAVSSLVSGGGSSLAGFHRQVRPPSLNGRAWMTLQDRHPTGSTPRVPLARPPRDAGLHGGTRPPASPDPHQPATSRVVRPIPRKRQ